MHMQSSPEALLQNANADLHEVVPFPKDKIAFNALKKRLLETPSEQIVLIADCDLTLANKRADRFHDIELDDYQYSVLRKVSETFAQTMVLTARGEQSTLDAIYGNREKFPMVMASNCGHRVMEDASNPESARHYIPIGHLTLDQVEMARDAMNAAFASVTELFKLSSGRIILDPRELCGAIVIESFDHEHDVKAFREVMEAACDALPEEVASITKYVSKYMDVYMVPQGKEHLSDAEKEIYKKKCGYTDGKMIGMTKSSVSKIFEIEAIKKAVPEQPLVMVVGDSGPDLDMMATAKDKWGADNVVLIWVGEDASLATARKDLEIHQIKGDQWTAIPKFYELLEAAASSPVTPYAPLAGLTSSPRVG